MSANGSKPPKQYRDIASEAGLTLTKEGWIIDDPDPEVEPQFTVSEVAKVFFGMSPYWVRWNENRGFFKLNNKPVGNNRKIIHPLTKEQVAAKKAGRRVKAEVTYFIDDGSGNGVRTYTLYDIERMAYALMTFGAIDGMQLLGALRVIESVAMMYNIIGPGSIEIEVPSPRDVPCERCGAIKDEPCRRLSEGETEHVDSFHKVRHEAFNESVTVDA